MCPHSYLAGYKYGKAFATHFGPSHGTGMVRVMEVGNEPWYYDDQLYSEVLLGMARGAKEGDPQMKVLPGSLRSLAQYRASVNATHLQYLDGVQLHAYSWAGTAAGRTGTHPEDPSSSFGEVLEQLRFWRSALGEGMPMYVFAPPCCPQQRVLARFVQA